MHLNNRHKITKKSKNLEVACKLSIMFIFQLHPYLAYNQVQTTFLSMKQLCSHVLGKVSLEWKQLKPNKQHLLAQSGF